MGRPAMPHEAIETRRLVAGAARPRYLEESPMSDSSSVGIERSMTSM